MPMLWNKKQFTEQRLKYQNFRLDVAESSFVVKNTTIQVHKQLNMNTCAPNVDKGKSEQLTM